MVAAMANRPNPKCSSAMMETASPAVVTIMKLRVRSMRWPPMTMASNTAPKFDTTMMTASKVIEPAAAMRNCGGTPPAFASLCEKIAMGTKPATDSANMVRLPVLSSLLAVAKSPVAVASAAYF